MTYFI